MSGVEPENQSQPQPEPEPEPESELEPEPGRVDEGVPPLVTVDTEGNEEYTGVSHDEALVQLGSDSYLPITGSEDTCPLELKTQLLPKLEHNEKSTSIWTFQFKDGDRLETVRFTQFAMYGPQSAGTKYVLCCKLGEGSFSSVFKAWDTAREEFVALKFTLSRCVKCSKCCASCQ